MQTTVTMWTRGGVSGRTKLETATVTTADTKRATVIYHMFASLQERGDMELAGRSETRRGKLGHE